MAQANAVGPVYILGAGTSVCAGGPTVVDFKPNAERMLEPERHRTSDFFLGDAKLRDRADRALKLWDEVAPNANIEELYILVDLFRRAGVPEFDENLQEDLKYLIAKTLQKTIGRGESATHTRFVQDIWRRHLAIQRNATAERFVGRPVLVSLNWDIVLDNATERYEKVRLDYGPIDSTPDDRVWETVNAPRNDARPPLTLLKPHGSLNWWFCSRHDRPLLKYTRMTKGVLDQWEETSWPCPKCDHPMKVLFVPPLSQKLDQSDGSPLPAIWRATRGALAEARYVYFVGYSFPPADVQFRMLVTEALARNKRLREILVVTKPKFGTEKTQFEDRYADVFRGLKAIDKLRFKHQLFEDWVEEEYDRAQ